MKRKLAFILGMIVGSGVIAWLIKNVSALDFSSLIVIGGPALLLISLWRIVPLMTESWAWYLLFPPDHSRPWIRLILPRWIGESINNLLPVALIGGDVIRAILAGRLAPRVAGSPPYAGAAASSLLDFFLNLLMIVIFSVFGALLLLSQNHQQITADWREALWILIGLAIVGLIILWRVIASLRKNFLSRIVERMTKSIEKMGATHVSGGAETLDRILCDAASRRWALVASLAIKMTSWASRALEIWILMRILDAPIAFVDAMAIEGLITLIRSVVFFLPGALGAQEGGFMILCQLLGFPSATGLFPRSVKTGSRSFNRPSRAADFINQ